MAIAARREILPPLIAWSDFVPYFGAHFRQGEHITLIGRTGSGKTTLGLSLLPFRRFVLVLATKPKDPLIGKLKREGYYVTRKWPVSAEIHPRVVYWPKIERTSDVITQRDGLYDALSSVYEDGGWCVYADEIRYLAETLKLERLLQLLWLQGRSLGVSLVGGTQRPAWIPLEAFSQATHLFLWRENDARNLKRLGEIGGIDSKTLQAMVTRLDFHRHECLYVNTVNGTILRTIAERR